MVLLSTIQHPLLNETVIKTFSKNNVLNILDFLQEETDHLVRISKLSYKEIIVLRSFIIQQYKSPVKSGNEYYESRQTFASGITTGIEKLDAALSGGLPVGKIVEICGLPSSGKTQLVFTMISKITSISEYNVIYIDSKDDFSSTRINQILKENNCTDKIISDSLERIKVIKIWNMNDLIYFLHELHRNEKLCKFVRVIVLDSLPCLMLQHQGEKINDNLGLLNQFVNIARFLANEYKLSFLVLNIVTRWREVAMIDVEGEDSSSTWIEKKVPTLGKYWQHIPSLYLNLELKSEDNESKIKILIKTASDSNAPVEICFNLNSKGIT